MPAGQNANQTLIKKIQKLKKQRNAVLLAHNYQSPEIQDIADFLGDSLGLSRMAAQTHAEVIVFCGVHFMAETASILSPYKTVLLPDKQAGCPMADMITPEQLIDMKRRHPRAIVVGYVNSSALIKAELDICCTSANAVEVIQAVPEDKEIIFVPDKYLGAYTASQTGRKLIIWNGYCPTHIKIIPDYIKEAKRKYPQAEVLVHPECVPGTIDLADYALSTGGISAYVKKSSSSEFIIGTEIGMLHRLQQDNPGKKFYPVTNQAVCPNMKRITLEKVLWALEEMQFEVTVSPEIRIKAKQAVDTMLAIGKKVAVPT